jgi:nicotinate-nucleotide adenylyltransferase
MIRLGLFGGTFDPVHYGHLRTVESARRELELPKIWLLPNPRPPHKLTENLTPYAHRKAMLNLALTEFPHLEIATFEEDANGNGYTTDTVKRVIAALPAEPRELWLIVGADSMIELPLWKNPDVLFEDANVAVLPRPGFDLSKVEPRFLDRARVLQTPWIEVSATEIRRRIQTGESVSEMINPAVLAYIHTHSLYL